MNKFGITEEEIEAIIRAEDFVVMNFYSHMIDKVLDYAHDKINWTPKEGETYICNPHPNSPLAKYKENKE